MLARPRVGHGIHCREFDLTRQAGTRCLRLNHGKSGAALAQAWSSPGVSSDDCRDVRTGLNTSEHVTMGLTTLSTHIHMIHLALKFTHYRLRDRFCGFHHGGFDAS